MFKLTYFFFVIAALGMLGCATGSPGAKSGAVKEDFSSHRITFDPQSIDKASAPEESRLEVSEDVDNNLTTGENIATALNSFLDSLAVSASNIRVVDGYTIQVYSGSSREDANKIRNTVYQMLPDYRPDLRYVQPTYKVKVGKFANRIEAQRVIVKLKDEVPNALILPEKITMD